MTESLLAVKKSILDRQCVLFLGSGLSSAAGLPGAPDLAKSLAEQLGRHDAEMNLQDLAQEFASVFTVVALKQHIRDALEEHLSHPLLDRSTFDLVAQIPHVHFVTTNWDNLLETSFPVAAVQTIFCDRDIPYWNQRRQNIIKMHGSIGSPDSLIVTRREYEKYPTDNPNMSDKIRQLLRDNALLICGYSLLDSTFRQIFLQALAGNQQLPHNVFWVDPFARETRVDEWRKNGVKFLPFTARDFFRHLLNELESPTARPAVTPERELRFFLQKAREVEQAFRILEDEAIEDFAFFREKIQLLAVISSRVVKVPTSRLSKLPPEKLRSLLDGVNWLRDLPIVLEELLKRHSARLRVANPDSVFILLQELLNKNSRPLASWTAELEKRLSIAVGRPFQGAERLPVTSELEAVITSALAGSGLRRYSAFLDLIRNRRSELRTVLEMATDSPVKRSLQSTLWRSCDLFLLEEHFGEGNQEFDLLGPLLTNSADLSVQKVIFTLSLFGRQPPTDSPLSIQELKSKLANKALVGHDTETVLRCLTFHFYSVEIREFAVRTLDMRSLWTLVAFDLLPMRSVLPIGHRIIEMGNQDLVKVLFDLRIDAPGELSMEAFPSSQDTEPQEFLLLFAASEVLLEDSYFERFVAAVRAVGKWQEELLLPRFRELLTTIEEGERELQPARPPAHRVISSLPDTAINKLARNVIYLRYLITASDNQVAVLGLALIRDSAAAAAALKIREINGELLRRIAKSKSLMTSYSARKALLFNPKTTIAVGEAFLSGLRNHDLIVLAKSRNVDGGIRDRAGRLVRSRGLLDRD